jgi:hypothetical protein
VICAAIAARGGAWTSDGRILFASQDAGLFQISASGGSPSPLTVINSSRGEGRHGWPQALPGGRFLYSVQSGKPEIAGVYAATFAKPAERVRLLPTATNALYAPGSDGKEYLLWMRGETLVAQEFHPGTFQLAQEPRLVADPVGALGDMMHVAVSAGGVLLYSAFSTVSQFTWLDRAGKPVGLVGEPGEYSTFRLSPDGRHVAVTRAAAGGANLWLLEPERRGASRLTLNSSYAAYPVWSPDGLAIVFSSNMPRYLFRTESSGAGDEQPITQSPHNQFVTDWSRDGRWLLYHENSPSGQHLWILLVTPDGRPAPGATAKPYLRTQFNERWGRFSPQSPPRWVAYQSDVTGRYEIYIQAFPEPRGKFQISTSGGQFPQWGTGGRELFYVSLENKLMVASLKLGADSVEPSTPRELFPLPVVDMGFSPYDTTQDGQRFLVRAAPGKAGAPLTVIVNWTALLKKEAPAQ